MQRAHGERSATLNPRTACTTSYYLDHTKVGFYRYQLHLPASLPIFSSRCGLVEAAGHLVRFLWFLASLLYFQFLPSSCLPVSTWTGGSDAYTAMSTPTFDDGSHRFSPISSHDHAGYVWIVTILGLIYSGLGGLARARIKWGVHGVDDYLLGLATVSNLLIHTYL